MHVISDEGESVRPKKKSKSSEFAYHKRDANTDTTAYDRALNEQKKLDILYNPIMPRMQKPVIEGKYKVTGNTRVILIVEHK